MSPPKGIPGSGGASKEGKNLLRAKRARSIYQLPPRPGETTPPRPTRTYTPRDAARRLVEILEADPPDLPPRRRPWTEKEIAQLARYFRHGPNPFDAYAQLNKRQRAFLTAYARTGGNATEAAAIVRGTRRNADKIGHRLKKQILERMDFRELARAVKHEGDSAGTP